MGFFLFQEPCSVFKAELFQGCSALVSVQLLKPEGLGLFRITGKFGEDGISVDSCPDPVAFGNQRFFKLFILLLRQFDAVLDLVKIKGVLSGIITAQRIHFGAVRRHDQKHGRSSHAKQGGSLFHILQHLLALPVNRFAFKFFRLVVTDADDIPFRPVFKFLRMEEFCPQLFAGRASRRAVG